MTQLTTQKESPAIIAYQSPKVRDMADSELFQAIGQQAQKVCAFAGQALPDNPTMFAALVAASIKETGCTIEQFKIAVHEGMTNTEIYSANAPATYNKWVRAYLDKVRMELSDYRAKVFATPKREPTEEEVIQMNIDHVLSMYESFKSGKVFMDGGSAGYLWLEKIGEINLSVEEKKQAFNDVHERAIAAIAAKKQEVSQYEARSIQSILDKIHQGDEVDELKFEKIKICRHDILKEYFMCNELDGEYLKGRYEKARAKITTGVR